MGWFFAIPTLLFMTLGQICSFLQFIGVGVMKSIPPGQLLSSYGRLDW